MGSCISKCRPKTKCEDEYYESVQDKLVISQQAPISVIDINKPPSPSPSPSPSHSTSSFSCTTASSSSCSSSSSSSVSSSKDRSFSNEFLWSCAKENPHVLCTDPIKESPVKSVSSKFRPPSPPVAPAKQLMPQRALHVGSTPQKRVRASNSPVLVRQKSFRREPERPNSAYSIPSRATLRSSPSPSRRFEGDKSRGIMFQANNVPLESVCKQSSISPQRNTFHPSPSSVRKGSGNFRPPTTPNNNSSRQLPCLRNSREMGSHPCTASKIGEIAEGEVLSNLGGVDSLPMEDIDNPLISLDCFIFL